MWIAVTTSVWSNYRTMLAFPKKTAGACWGLLTLQLVVLPNQVRHRCEEVDEARLHTAPPVPLSLTGRPCAAVCRNLAVSGVRVGPA